jgi:tryptophan-rich sensory protein
MPVTRRLDLPRLVAAILVCQAAGAIGGFATASSVETWYVTLRKSSLNPPPWVFGPVWTTLYTLMGIALYRMWMRARRAEADGGEAPSFALFWTQLGLNTAWSLVFFGLRAPFGALATLVALLAAIVATMRAFGRVDRAAALLLAPYAAWVTFAGFLNASVWWLNRE